MSRIRVALETQFAVGKPTGLGVYAAGLAQALQARDDVELIELRDDRFDLWRFDRRGYWDQVRAPAMAARAHPDVLHFTGGTLPIRTPHPVVLTLHDVVWLRGANRGRFYVRWYFGSLQRALARRADAIVVDTMAARTDVADALAIDAARIHVCGAGVDESFFTIKRAPSDPPFVLCVGTVEERKDLATAVAAAARIDGLRLISVGPFTPYVDRVRKVAREHDTTDRVELRGYVDTATLLDLYARAALLAFPSRYEGFGLPPVQALACGLPVVAARIPVTDEVLGDCALYAKAGDADGFAAAFRAALAAGSSDITQRGIDRARAFGWSAVADKTVRVYRSLI